MTITHLTVDGWPYVVDFTGTIEIARLWDDSVAIIRNSPDALVTIALDGEALERSRELMARLRHESQVFTDYFSQVIDEEYWKAQQGRDTGERFMEDEDDD